MVSSIYNLNEAAVDERLILDRLERFNPKEVQLSLEFGSRVVPLRLVSTLETAGKIIDRAGLQLKNENLTFLEETIHSLRGTFMTIGCERLAFLLERIYKNLTKIKIDFLFELFELVKEEFEYSKKTIFEYIENYAIQAVPREA